MRVPGIAAAALLAGSVAAGLGLAGAGTAYAQANPSADQIINSLKPSGAIGGGTRGIRPSGTAPAPSPSAPSVPAAMPSQAAPTPPPAQTAASRPPAPARPPSVNLSVQFATGSAELTPAAMATLDELGRALTSDTLAGYRFRIEGHTDTVGTPELNKALSDQRAAAVAAYLTTRFGVPGGRLDPVGMGENGLLVATPPQTPEPRNRRVQIVNLGA